MTWLFKNGVQFAALRKFFIERGFFIGLAG